jgi:hypothetical protein
VHAALPLGLQHVHAALEVSFPVTHGPAQRPEPQDKTMSDREKATKNEKARTDA